MPAIDSITGIDLVAGTDREYEISADVAIGSGIDDPPEFSVFTVVSGGKWRFTAGCTTTFDRCTFIERDASTAYAEDNYFSGTDCRFSGGATCAPVFKGCVFIQEDGMGRSDWDVSSDGAAPTFQRADDGAQCVIKTHPLFQFNHFASSNITIDGLIMNHGTSLGAMEFVIPPTISEMKIVDANPGSGQRHVVVLIGQWGTGATYSIDKLDCRNCATWEGNNTGEILVLNNPVGTPDRGTDTTAQRGIMEVYRTYSVAAQDASDLSTLNPTIVITADSDNDVRFDEALVSGAFSDNLLQYSLPYRTTATNPDTKTFDDDYRRALVLWGYDPKVLSFTVDYDANSPDGRDDGTLFFFEKSGVTEALQSTVDAFTALENTAKLFDAFHRYEIARTDRHNVGTLLAEGIGSTMDIQANNLVLTNAVVAGYPLVLAGSTFTAYTEGSAFSATAFDGITTTGTVTFSQSNMLPDGFTVNGDAVISQVTDTDNLTVTGDLTLETAGTYDWTNMQTGSVGNLINTSGGAITINSDNANFPTTNTGPNITIVAPVDTYTFNSDTTATLIRYFTDDSQTIVDSTTGITLDYEFLNTNPVDAEFVKQGYVPVNRQDIVPTNNGSLDVIMDFDEAYNSGHGLTITTEYDYNRATKVLTINSDQEAIDVRSSLADTIRTNSSYYNTPLLMVAIPGLIRVDLIDGMTITSMATWKGAGMERYDSADSTNPVEKWFALKSLADITGANIYYRQTSSGSATAGSLTGGVLNEAFQYWSDPNHDGSTADGYDYSGYMVVKSFLAGSKEGRVDVVAASGLSALQSSAYTIGLTNTAGGYSGTDPGVTANLTLVAGGTVGGESFSYEWVDGATTSAEDIANQIHYNKINIPNSVIAGGTGLTWWEISDAVVFNGSNVETERGYEEGATPTLVGFYVSRSSADHPGFSRFQADNGNYYTPADTVLWTAANFLNDTRVRLYNVTQATEIDNSVVSGGGGYSYTLVPSTDFNSGDQITMLATYQSGGTAKQVFRFSTSVTTADIAVTDSQVDWDSPGPNTLAIDGSTVSECATDYVGVQVEVTDSDDTTQKSRIAAFIVDALTTEDGIRNWVALDGSSVISYSTNTAAQIDAAVATVEVINQKTTSTLSVKDSFEFDWSDGVDRVSAVSGSSIIWLAPDRVLLQETGVSGLTGAESTELFKNTTISNNVDLLIQDQGLDSGNPKTITENTEGTSYDETFGTVTKEVRRSGSTTTITRTT